VKKVLVVGKQNAGKTTFVRNISESTFAGTDVPVLDLKELKETGETTTVGVEVNFYKDIAFYGLPGQRRFSFLWETFAKSFDGIVFLHPSFSPPEEIDYIYSFFSKFPSFQKSYKMLIFTYPEKMDYAVVNRIISVYDLPYTYLNPNDRSKLLKVLEVIENNLMDREDVVAL